MGPNENLWSQFKRQDVMTKIMVLNGLVFLVLSIGAALMGWSRSSFYSWFALPDDLLRFIGQPWSLLTYSFLHSGFFHLLFNMIWLSFFGRFVLNLFSERRFLTLYLLGGIVAGLVYLISYNIFPAFLGAPRDSSLGPQGRSWRSWPLPLYIVLMPRFAFFSLPSNFGNLPRLWFCGI